MLLLLLHKVYTVQLDCTELSQAKRLRDDGGCQGRRHKPWMTLHMASILYHGNTNLCAQRARPSCLTLRAHWCLALLLGFAPVPAHAVIGAWCSSSSPCDVWYPPAEWCLYSPLYQISACKGTPTASGYRSASCSVDLDCGAAPDGVRTAWFPLVAFNNDG